MRIPYHGIRLPFLSYMCILFCYIDTMVKLRIAHYLELAQASHFARVELRSPTPTDMHTHDFHEIFWVDSGRGTHWINSGSHPLYPGILMLIRAPDRHGFSVKPPESIHITNIAFACSTWESLWKRYLRTRPDPLLKPQHNLREFHLDSQRLEDLQAAASLFQHGRRDRLITDGFLLAVMAALPLDHSHSGPAQPPASQAPAWIQQLHSHWSPDAFAAGTRGMAARSGKSPEHLARMLRRYLGKSPTDLLNDARMLFAARQLAVSDQPILQIALDCGIQNLGHFYALFHQHFHTSPARYRTRQRNILGAARPSTTWSPPGE